MSVSKKALHAMGVPLFIRRASVASRDEEGAHERLDVLAQTTRNCRRCALCDSRTQVVFGTGSPSARLFLVGEAPGQQEDLRGEPFVGRAGQLLNNILHAIGLKRESVYIANVLKCRPPQNRDPLPEEVRECTPYLDTQIELIQPSLMVALGRVAAHYLLQTDASLSQLRERTWSYGPSRTPVYVTFHPAYLLRSPREKRRAYQDWLKIKKSLIVV